MQPKVSHEVQEKRQMIEPLSELFGVLREHRPALVPFVQDLLARLDAASGLLEKLHAASVQNAQLERQLEQQRKQMEKLRLVKESA